MDNITNRDRNKIRIAIADKLVDKICNELINGQPLIQHLRETLGNTMVNVLNNPENKSKITQTIFQSVDSALKIPSSGPLLLHGLLSNEESYNYVQNYISTIFSRIYKENDTINLFTKRLYQQLRNPPYQSWFSQKGGKKRKTIRNKNKFKNNHLRKTKRKTIYYGGKIELTKIAQNYAEDYAKNKKDEMNEVVDNLVKESTEQPHRELIDTNNQQKTEDESKASYLEKINLKKREMTGGEIEQNADELLKKFGNSLIENVTSDIPTISPQILQRMLNASYVHALKNGDQLLNSAQVALSETIKTTPLLMDIFPIILVQALYNSNKIISESIVNTLHKQNEDARKKGEKNTIPFKPLDPNFIVIFMEILKKNVLSKIL